MPDRYQIRPLPMNKPQASSSVTANLLIIEDDPEFAGYLQRGLTYEGYQVQVAATAESGLKLLSTQRPDLLILDVMLPGMDGMDACRTLCQSDFSGSILILTARNAVDDRVTGLDAGADDYLGKPFAFDELLARLRALLRRHTSTGSIVTFADLELDAGLYVARRRDEAIPLSRTDRACATSQATRRSFRLCMAWAISSRKLHDPLTLAIDSMPLVAPLVCWKGSMVC